MEHHLAQINIARMRFPLDDPAMAGFVDNLEAINALAEADPGFVWRLQTDEGDATALRIFDDDRLIVNLSVWGSVEALKGYVYQSRHVNFVRRRKAWFEAFDGAYYALWWVPRGHTPTVEEAKARLEHLQQHGESAFAFSFKEVFAPEAAEVAAPSG